MKKKLKAVGQRENDQNGSVLSDSQPGEVGDRESIAEPGSVGGSSAGRAASDLRKVDLFTWDYYSLTTSGFNGKFLCTELSLTINSYQWETGKADPGPPQFPNFNELSSVDTCTDISDRVTHCVNEVTRKVERPASRRNALRVFTTTLIHQR